MSTSSPELLVAVDPPAFPLRLATATFITTLNEVEATVKAHKVTDEASLQVAASLQIRLTAAGKQLDKARKELKAPILEIGRKIEEAAREPLERIEAAKNLLKAQLNAYDAEQRRLATIAESARQSELKRLEEIAAKERAEAARKQAEIEEAARLAAEKSKVHIVDIDDEEPSQPSPKTETEKAIEAVRYAPAAVIERAAGITYKVFLVPIVEDVDKIPDEFVSKLPKLAAIKSTFCTGWIEGTPIPLLPGVRFEVKRDAISSGRAEF